MANKSTITYNGATIATEERDGDFAVVYNGSTIATIAAGATKTLKCAGKVMATDVLIGGKTLNCWGELMATDVVVSVVSLFPSAPSAYNLIGTYASSQTWTAPEDGYFQIEVFGASGAGATSVTDYNYSAGGGGGGGYSASRIKMNKGDTIVLTVGAVGSTTIAVINSGVESYSSPQVTSGGNGSQANKSGAGAGGAGGVGSNGNYANASGSAGSAGSGWSFLTGYTGGAGGSGTNGAPNGGDGSSIHGLTGGSDTAAGSGSPGFFKIYRGNTNVTGGGNADLPAYDAVLANNSWETISQIARLGKASEIWNIGDTKNIVVEGITYPVRIMDFDMYDVTNSASYGRAKAGIVFQFDQVPDSTYSFSDAQTTANNLISNSECSALIPIIRYPSLATKNASAVTIYEAKGINISEYEAFGTNKYENIPVGTQYAYYAAGNSKVKKLVGGVGSSSYWTRSLYKSGATTQTGVYIAADGAASGYSTGKLYIAPVFCL